MNHAEQSIPLISVVIPAYNAESYIQSTLDSVFNQTYQNIEVIVVDDGSNDSTQSILNAYPHNVVVIKTENKGVSHARNIGIEKAKGEWIAFVDSDDLWLPSKLEKQLSSLGSCEWSHCDSLYIGENQSGDVKRSDYSHIPRGNVFEELIVENFITTSSVLIKKSLLNQYGKFDETLTCLEDWKLWIDISHENPIAYCDKSLLEYRVYSGSTSRKARSVMPIHIELIDQIFKALPSSTHYKKLKNKAKIKSLTICSYIAEEAQDYRFSLYCSYKAWTEAPLSKTTLRRLIASTINQLVYKPK